jgi:hypothetical protein
VLADERLQDGDRRRRLERPHRPLSGGGQRPSGGGFP